MSGLAWIRPGCLIEKFSVFSTGTPMHVGKGTCPIVDDGSLEFIPQPRDPRAGLALALYREASSVNVVSYGFLGYFKIINILHDSGAAQRTWVSSAATQLTDIDACKRRDEILIAHGNVGDYLWRSGRCAIAHAYDPSSVVNPDSPDDNERLGADLPLIKSLAEHAIEHELGVKSLRTVEAEHLYELQGFRGLLDPSVVASLNKGDTVAPEKVVIPGRLDLRLRDSDPFPSFENLSASMHKIVSGTLQVHLQRDDQLFGSSGKNGMSIRIPKTTNDRFPLRLVQRNGLLVGAAPPRRPNARTGRNPRCSRIERRKRRDYTQLPAVSLDPEIPDEPTI